MTSQFVTRFAFAFMFPALLAGVQPALAQTSLGWGQHVSRYGSGYVGNAPNSLPLTNYYRGPAMAPGAYGQPATSYYAPTVVAPNAIAPAGYAAPVTSGYSPGVSYRVGTPNAAAYSSAYSPIVTSTTPYAANWQYPPQTVMPTVANYAPQGYGNYAATPPAYTTNYAQTPVTYYRPVTVMSPVGATQTVLQPCTGAECQAQRRPHCCCFGWLFNHHRPAAAVPTAVNYPCASGACGQPAPVSVPYYTPGPVTVTPLNSGVFVPANLAPTLSGPPTTTVVPGTNLNNVVPPSSFNSGGNRADYAPATDAYCPPPVNNFRPNVSPTIVSPAPSVPFAPIAPLSNGGSSNGSSTNGTDPADVSPSLNGPANVPQDSQNSAPADDGAQLRSRPTFHIETQQPRAVIRRDNGVTPIPDPEYRDGVRAKVNKAPQLLAPPRDRTAQSRQADAHLANFEREVSATPAKPAARKVIGDDAWRSAK